MKTIAAIFFICSTFCSFASLAPSKTTNAFNHLSEVNKEWIANAHLTKNKNISFQNDTERIRYHLLEVETILRSKNSSHLTANQLQKRQEMLNILHQYALDMQFPQNTYHSNRQPYFIDIYGTHCAVGYLVMKSGHGDISKSISQTQNYAYVHEIDSPELLEWSEEFGFTVEELAWIQPGYEYNTPYNAVGTGTNGRVLAIEHSNIANKTFIAGNFSMLGDVPCDNIASYDGNQLSCLGGGLTGVVNGISVREYGYPTITYIYAVGKFEHNGASYPIAKWVNNEWEYISIPNMPQAEGTAVYSSNSSLIVGVKQGNQYALKEWEFMYGDWNSSNTIQLDGPVLTISHKNFGGKFNTIYHSYSYLNQTQQLIEVNDTIQTSNIAIGKFNTSPYNSYVGITENLPDTIFSIIEIGVHTYVSGSANVINNNSSILSRITNDVAQPLIQVSSNNMDNSIYDIAIDYNYNQLLLAGKLSIIDEFGVNMISGRHLLSYNLTSGYLTAKGNFNNPVYSVSYQNDILMVGGDFTSSLNSEPIFHLAKQGEHLNIEDLSEKTDFSLFPNPVTSEFKLSNIGENAIIEITDVQGKTVVSSFEYNGSVNVEHLPNGVYIVKVKENQSIGTVQFVKN